MTQASGPRVALFVTCLVDAMRPQIGFAALQLLEEAGCRVEVPRQQTCCGQPAWNSGDAADAASIAPIARLLGADQIWLTGDAGVGALAQRLAGSSEIFRHAGRTPQAGVHAARGVCAQAISRAVSV